jgi:hypothetical protein
VNCDGTTHSSDVGNTRGTARFEIGVLFPHSSTLLGYWGAGDDTVLATVGRTRMKYNPLRFRVYAANDELMTFGSRVYQGRKPEGDTRNLLLRQE